MARLSWALGIGLLVMGCGVPGYTSSMRTNFTGDVPIWTHCFRYTDKAGEAFSDHISSLSKEGWRLAYMSEYASSSKSVYTYCLERARTEDGTTSTPPYTEKQGQ